MSEKHSPAAIIIIVFILIILPLSLLDFMYNPKGENNDNDNTDTIAQGTLTPNIVQVKTKDIVEANRNFEMLGYNLIYDVSFTGLDRRYNQDNYSIETENMMVICVQYEKYIYNIDSTSYNEKSVVTKTHNCYESVLNQKTIAKLEHAEEGFRKVHSLRLIQDLKRGIEEAKDSLYFSINGIDYFSIKHNNQRLRILENHEASVSNFEKNHPVMLYNEYYHDFYRNAYGLAFVGIWHEYYYQVDWQRYFKSTKFAEWVSLESNKAPTTLDYQMTE